MFNKNFNLSLPSLMGRLLAIDYGTKRTGLAVTDPLRIIATGLTTIPTNDLLSYLKTYTTKEDVDCFIIGLPKQMNNTPSESMNYIEAFVKNLKREIPHIAIQYYDERFTSVLAHRTMLEGGLKKKDRQNKALVDEISAVILLQSYMESSIYKKDIL